MNNNILMNNQISSNQLSSSQSNLNGININMNMNKQSLNLKKIISIGKKNKEYKIKINNLEKYIKELQIKLEEKEKIINEEKIKNDNLRKEIKNLNNIPNFDSKIKELENEIKLFKSYYNFSEGEKLILIKIISGNQDINFNKICKNTEEFSKIESLLYKKYPKYIESENYFLVHGGKINRHKSLKENKINNNDVITLEVINFD